MASAAMRVALAADCSRPTSSGVVTSMLQLREGLERRGHRVIVITVETPGGSGPEPGVYRFPSLPFNAASGFRLGLVSPRTLARILRAEGVQLVHTHTEWSMGWAARCAAGSDRSPDGAARGLPLVHTAHTLIDAYRHYLPLGEELPRGLVRAYLGRFLGPYSAIVCPSERIQNYLASFLPGLPAVVIGNGLNRALFDCGSRRGEIRERARGTWGVQPDERLILYVGRLGKEKRVAELLAALIPLLQAQPSTRFLMAGSGPGRRALEQGVAGAGLESQVIFAGALPWDSMRTLYIAADVLVTASMSEVQPMSLIEAAMAGLPVVARRDEATASVVQDEASGYLVDSDAEIASRLAELLGQEGVRLRFSQAALALSWAFDLETHVDRIEGLYRGILDSRSR